MNSAFFLYKKTLLIIVFLLISIHSVFAQFTNATQQVTTRVKKTAEEAKVIIDRIRAVKQQVQSSDLYKDLVDGKEVNLPVAIKQGDNEDYALYLDSIIITPTKTYAVIYMAIPYEGETLYFGANDIAFSKEGGFVGEPTISLLKSAKVKFGNYVNQHFLADDFHQTYIKFDCKGFKELHIDGKMVFDNTIAIPEDANGKLNPKDSVQLDFAINVKNLNDFLIEFQSINKFRLAKLPDCSFMANGMIFDHSDTKNSNYTSFPDVYKNKFTVNDNGNIVPTKIEDKDVSVTWQGFSVKEAEITFPKAFKKEGGQKTSVAFKELIIDRQGFSGQVGVKNILSWEKAKSNNGFKISLDTIYVAFVQNNFIGGGFGGKMNIPINKENTQLDYIGGIMNVGGRMKYTADVALAEKMDFDCFRVSKVILMKGSRINLAIINENFDASALLTGSITVGTEVKSTSEDKANFQIDFEELYLATSKPYFSVKKIGTNSEISTKIGNVEITISNIDFETKNAGENVGLSLDIGASLSGGSSGFGGSAGLTIWAKRNIEGRWGFDNVEFTKLCIDVNNKSYSFSGCLEKFDGVPIYGSGYAGSLKLTLEKPQIEIVAKGIFGSVVDATDANNTYKYWFVDAGAKLPIGIPIAPAFEINGFYGGVSHHMTMDAKKVADYSAANATIDANPSDPTNEMGKSLSGSIYVPNKDSYIGIRFGVNFASAKSEEVLNGQLVFFAGLSEGMGLDYLGIEGGAQMLKPDIGGDGAKSVASKSDPQSSSKDNYNGATIRLEWKTAYYVKEEIFEGNFGAFINVGQFLKGSKDLSTGKAGDIEIYVNGKTGKWYTYIGTPQNMNGIQLQLAGIAVNLQSYFVMGNLLPSPPIADYPPQVTFSGARLVDSPLLKMASGFAFGARLNIKGEGGGQLGGSCYVKVGARLEVGAGFDMLFIKINKEILPATYCGIDRDNIGINGWYAAGQLFGYAVIDVFGEVGCKVDLGMLGSIDKSFGVNLLKLNASLALQGQGPRPTSFSGEFNLGLQLPIMGTVSMKFKGTLGDKCDSDMNNADLLLISSVSPTEGQQEVDVYAKVIVKFKSAIGSELPILNKEGKEVKVTLLFNETSGIKVSYTDKNKVLWPVAGKIELSKDKMSATFVANEALPEDAVFDVVASIDYSISGKITERVEVRNYKFQTRKEDYLIPLNNVRFSYPLPNMDNYYTKESNKGFVKFFVKPSKAFSSEEGYTYRVQICRGENIVYSTGSVTILESNTKVLFKLPTNELDASSQYTFKLIKIAIKDTLSIGKKLETGIQSGYSEGTALKPKYTLLEFNFKTSKYNTFTEKMSSFSKSTISMSNGVVSQKLDPLSANSEAFSFVESDGYSVEGNNTTGVLIKATIKYNSTKLTAINALYSVFTPSPEADGKIVDAKNCIKFTSVMNVVNAQYNAPAIIKRDYLAAKSQNINTPSVDDLKFVSGEVCNYEVGYYLPGETVPNSKTVISFNIPEKFDIQ